MFITISTTNGEVPKTIRQRINRLLEEEEIYLNKKVSQVAWNPAMPLLAIAVETEVQIFSVECKRDRHSQNAEQLLQVSPSFESTVTFLIHLFVKML